MAEGLTKGQVVVEMVAERGVDLEVVMRGLGAAKVDGFSDWGFMVLVRGCDGNVGGVGLWERRWRHQGWLEVACSSALGGGHAVRKWGLKIGLV
ncbi:hypothetical protein RIF29_30239 [Crotalaria pallida]|uniref:Uncharacterized protein n=1 Tax=Crotalaria pallida TaxID=3830 RepID=A0AAN9EIB5_CROPI